MSIVFLNDAYLPMEEARISPMDRGFLFGDSIYEVIPTDQGKLIGFSLHMDRMQRGLQQVGNGMSWTHGKWMDLCHQLMDKNSIEHPAVYIQISRGADDYRFHAYPVEIESTVFAFAFESTQRFTPGETAVKGCKVSTSRDTRWKNCHIKSTSLLGNVMHFQQGYVQGKDETLLYNEKHELTEGSASNVFIVKDSVVITPPLDTQILPGVTRHILLDILRSEGSLNVEERIVTMDEVCDADEVWLTSSTKEIAPVTEIDGRTLGNGGPGAAWELAQKLYSTGKFNY